MCLRISPSRPWIISSYTFGHGSYLPVPVLDEARDDLRDTDWLDIKSSLSTEDFMTRSVRDFALSNTWLCLPLLICSLIFFGVSFYYSMSLLPFSRPVFLVWSARLLISRFSRIDFLSCSPISWDFLAILLCFESSWSAPAFSIILVSISSNFKLIITSIDILMYYNTILGSISQIIYLSSRSSGVSKCFIYWDSDIETSLEHLFIFR